MKNALLILLFVSSVSTSVFSQALYSNTSYASRFNPGIGLKGTPVIAYDDINIPVNTGSGSDSTSITKINIGIRRAPNAPATNVHLYFTSLTNDSAGNNVVSSVPVLLGKIALPVNGASLITSIVSLGDSATALFKISNDPALRNNGFKVLIGASFDNPSQGNGIILSKSLNDSSDSLWIDATNGSKELYTTSFSSHIPASYHLEVYGGSSNNLKNIDKKNFADVAANKITNTKKLK